MANLHVQGMLGEAIETKKGKVITPVVELPSMRVFQVMSDVIINDGKPDLAPREYVFHDWQQGNERNGLSFAKSITAGSPVGKPAEGK